MEKVIALIDLVGDQVVDAQEAYELFADADARPPHRMTMLGLTKALDKLSYVLNDVHSKQCWAWAVLTLVAAQRTGQRRLPQRRSQLKVSGIC